MRVLFVCSGNGKPSPFIKEQSESLRKEGVQVEFFKITGKGIFGYLKNRTRLIQTLKRGNFDLIHAHYGLSGLLATLQQIVPVIITFHGSDVNRISNRFFSLIASRLAHYSILVNKMMARQLFLRKKYRVIPCGIDFSVFFPMNKQKACTELGFHQGKTYILFSSAFNNPVKNYPLAKEAIEKLEVPVEFIELKNRTRQEVNLLFNACDMLLMTSKTEGSPQVVKEALACNTPVVSTDVGDVKQFISGLDNCYITSSDPKDIADKIQRVLESNKSCDGRKVVEPYELQQVACSVKDLYMDVLQRKELKK